MRVKTQHQKEGFSNWVRFRERQRKIQRRAASALKSVELNALHRGCAADLRINTARIYPMRDDREAHAARYGADGGGTQDRVDILGGQRRIIPADGRFRGQVGRYEI